MKWMRPLFRLWVVSSSFLAWPCSSARIIASESSVLILETTLASYRKISSPPFHLTLSTILCMTVPHCSILRRQLCTFFGPIHFILLPYSAITNISFLFHCHAIVREVRLAFCLLPGCSAGTASVACLKSTLIHKYISPRDHQLTFHEIMFSCFFLFSQTFHCKNIQGQRFG